MHIKDLSNRVFGKLSVIGLSGRNKYGKALWLCVCDCGRQVSVDGTKLRLGLTSSCGTTGCKVGTSHGLSKKSKAYGSWKSMKARCMNPQSSNYIHYGAKGIGIDPAWINFENFLADMGEPPNGTVLDRKHSEQGYSKSNCRWATFKQSTENRRNTIWIDGVRLADFAEMIGLNYSIVWQRLNRMGWTVDEIKLYPFRMKKVNQVTQPQNDSSTSADVKIR